MSENYAHLGTFSDWVAFANTQRDLYPLSPPGSATRAALAQNLGFSRGPEGPRQVRLERTWVKDGVAGEELSWSVGYGPRTHAWLLRPEGVYGPLPGVLALHDHGGFKFFGKEKIADGPDPVPPVIMDHWNTYYSGRGFANALARQGFAVLVPDTFLWGSRRFPLADMPAALHDSARAELAMFPPAIDRSDSLFAEVYFYNKAAGTHEHLVEKYCNLLGTTLAGVVAYEDRVAVNYLLSRPDVDPAKIACVGLSGGGNRSTLLLATHDAIQAAVIVGLMCTYPALLDHNVLNHTWMFFPSGWSRIGDWPDIAACRAPLPLLVQYDNEDNLFTLDGMQSADRRIAGHYAAANRPDAYTGQFFPGDHKFDLEMQTAAFSWLRAQLSCAD